MYETSHFELYTYIHIINSIDTTIMYLFSSIQASHFKIKLKINSHKSKQV